MNKLVFKNQKFYFFCDFAHREIAKKAGFKWCAENKCWFTEDKFVVALLIKNFEKIDCSYMDHLTMTELQRLLSNFQHSFTEEQKTKLITENLKLFQGGAVETIVEINQNWLLADEQGLGKTIQCVALINEKLNKPVDGSIRVLVICPSTVKVNWRNEILAWIRKDCAPHIHIINKRAEYFGGGLPASELPILDVKIINYDLLSPSNMAFLRMFKPDLMILDEAHYLKNRESERTKKVFLAKDALAKFATQIICLTGTPITKYPADIWPICRTLCPEAIAPYKSYWDFVKKFCTVKQNVFGWEITGSKNEEELGLRLRATFMIRRTKDQVLKQLERKRFQLITLAKNKTTGEIIKKEASLPQDEMDLAIKKQQIKPTGHMATLRRELGIAKLPECIEFIKDQLESEEKIVVFAWHTEVIEKLMEEFSAPKKNYLPVCIKGDTPNKERQIVVDCFQKNKQCRIFIGNIQAAGVAITLTAASRVIFVESSWLPSDIDQAMDRCHRIGQQGSVLAQFLVVEDSIDARVLETVVSRMKNIKKTL